MNANNSDTPKWQLILAVITTFAVLGGFVALCIWNGLIGGITFAIFCFSLLFFALFRTAGLDKKSREFVSKQNELYGQEQAPNFDSFYFGGFYLDEGEFNLEIMREGIRILSNGEIEIPNSVFENEEKNSQKAYISEYLLQNLDEKSYGVNIDMKTELEDLVWNINRVIDKKKISINKLTSEQITAFDNSFVKNRRKDSIVTMDNDINIAHNIIEKSGYELINVLSDEYCLTIVNTDELLKLKQLEEKSKVR